MSSEIKMLGLEKCIQILHYESNNTMCLLFIPTKNQMETCIFVMKFVPVSKSHVGLLLTS